VAFSDDGDVCVTGSDDTYLMVWDVASHQKRVRAMSGHQVRREGGREGREGGREVVRVGCGLPQKSTRAGSGKKRVRK